MTHAVTDSIPTSPRRVLMGTLMLVGVGVSLLFLYTGIEKWSDIGRFQATIETHRLLHGTAAQTAAITMATAEVGVGGIGLALLILKGPSVTALVLLLESGLFLVFAIYAALLIAQPPPEPTSCGCSLLAGVTANWSGILTRSTVIATGLGAVSLLALRANADTFVTPDPSASHS